MTAREEQASGAVRENAAAEAGLKSTTPNSYEELSATELAERVASCKEQGFRFIQMCATTTDDGVELLYSFSDPDPRERAITAFTVQVGDGARVPSISADYSEAFVNENEAHDLFGVSFDGLGLDYEGSFYMMPISYPMNPRAAKACAEAAKREQEGAATCGDADAASDDASAAPAPDAASAGAAGPAPADAAREEAADE